MIRRYLKVAAIAFVATAWLPASGTFNVARAQIRSVSQPASSTIDEILVAQRLLMVNGYAVSEVNGVLTEETRQAIRSFQRQNSLRVDGRVNMSVMTFLAAHAVDLVPGGDAEDILNLEGSDNGALDHESRATISLVQRVLARHGFEPARIDGLMVEETRQAIRNFQAQMGLEVTGNIDDSLLTTLDEFIEVTREFSDTSR